MLLWKDVVRLSRSGESRNNVLIRCAKGSARENTCWAYCSPFTKNWVDCIECHSPLSAPFTLQRLCELMSDPRCHYSNVFKLTRGVEKVMKNNWCVLISWWMLCTVFYLVAHQNSSFLLLPTSFPHHRDFCLLQPTQSAQTTAHTSSAHVLSPLWTRWRRQSIGPKTSDRRR